MAGSMAGYKEIARLPQGEIMEELEDELDATAPLGGAVAVGHTVREGPMAASFNVDEGLKKNTLGLLRPEKIPRLLEDGYTFLHHVAATIGWTFRGSGSINSPGRIHDSVKLPDDQEIVEFKLYIMEEVMMPDWFRNFFSLLRKNGYEIISLSDTHGWVYKHDCVVVEIADEGIFIKAEKGGESSPLKNDGGIKLEVVRSPSHPKDWKDPGDKDSGRYSVRFEAVIKLGKGKEKLTVKQLKQLLSPSSGLDYNIFSANCWQYAFSTANNVLIWILGNSEDEEVQEEIRQMLEELKLLERPMPKDIFLALLYPSAPGSREIIVTYRQKLAGTFEGLPPNAILRRLLVLGIQKFVDWRAPRREDMADDGESASLTTTSSAAERPRIWEPSVEDEYGDHSTPVEEEYSEIMQESLQPTQYVYSCAPSMMDSGPWMSATPSVEPLLRQRKENLPPNSSEGPTSGSVVAQGSAGRRYLHYD